MMNSAVAQKNVTHLQLKATAITLFVALSTVLIVRVVLPSLFPLNEAMRQVYLSRVTVIYILPIIITFPGILKRLKEWSFGKTFLIVGVCSIVATFIMGLSNIIDL